MSKRILPPAVSFFAIFFWAIPSLSQLVLIQSQAAKFSNCGGSSACTLSINATTPGDQLVVVVNSAGTSTVVTGITDNASLSSVYVQAGFGGSSKCTDNGEGQGMGDIWLTSSASAGATQIRVSLSASVADMNIAVLEFSGGQSTAAVDSVGTVNSGGLSSTPAGASVTTTAPGDVIIATLPFSQTINTVNSPFVEVGTPQNNNGDGMAYFITNAAGTFTPHWNGSPAGSYCASTIALKPAASQAQSYLNATGKPTFATTLPLEMGYIDLANGNLHLEVPLTSIQQRGNVKLSASLVYDSSIWMAYNGATAAYWQPTNVPQSFAGWRLAVTGDGGSVSSPVNTTVCSGSLLLRTFPYFQWTDDFGTQRVFPIQTSQNQCTGASVSSGDALAQDSSGYHMYVAGYNHATVFASDGTQVYPSVKDTNGNYFSVDSSGNVIDTLGRTQVATTVNGSQIYYDVLNSQGSTSRYTVTITNASVNTAFGQTGVNEYSGSLAVIQTIALPDGSSYNFTYDSGATPGHYGLLASMTLRLGGQIGYSYTNFADSYGNINRWLATRSAAGTWNYTPQVLTSCATGTVGCQQQVTVQKPSGDQAVYAFTLNNGAWNTQLKTFTGASSAGTLLRTVVADYDFGNGCSIVGCSGNAYIRPLRITTTDPVPGGTISKKTEFSYDNIYNGNISARKEWNYYSGIPAATPSRETDYIYLTSGAYVNKDIRSLPSAITKRNSSGAQVALTNVTYDSGSLTAISGIVHHDDVNFGAANTVRGNATQIQRWVAGSSYLITVNAFDTTGQVLSVTDPRGNAKLYSYTDDFYTDGNPPANPPPVYTPVGSTNAYLTKVTLVNQPGSSYLQKGYYFNTGKLARDRDAEQNSIYHHYIDSLDRETHIYDRPLNNGTRGWTLTSYTSPTQQDVYRSITDVNASPSCAGCRHTVITLDTFSRGQTRSTLSSDPDGSTNSDIAFDQTGRTQSKSNPYRSTTDPTYGIDTFTYDGLDRQSQDTHQDNNSTHTYYGAAVSSAGGSASQLCSNATYGYGYPAFTSDEAGKKWQVWRDAFGNQIEVDEPDATNNLTLGTCYQYDGLNNLVQVVQGNQTRSYSYDGLSRETVVTEPESGTTNNYYINTDGSLCSGTEKDLCRRTDARGVTATYAYGPVDWLDSITYSDGTPTSYYFYEQTSYNGITTANSATRRSGMSDGSGLTAWSRDPAGNIVTEQRTINGVTKQIGYAYNLDGSISSISYPSGRTLAYTYSNAQRTTTIVDSVNAVNYVTSTLYAPQGQLTSMKNGITGTSTGITTTNSYNNRLQPVIHSASSANQTIYSLSYGYDVGGGANNGSVAQIQNNIDANRSATYTYDELNRVKAAATQGTTGSTCWGQAFNYDRYSNLLGVNVTRCSAPSLSVTVNGNNQIADSGFFYDAAGNLTNDGINAYSWDAENRLTTTAGVTYAYDGDGQRVKTSRLYWRDLKGDVLEEDSLAGNVQREFVYLSGTRVARRESSGAVFYYYSDRLGSARILADATGNVQRDSDYYPFGGELAVSGSVDNTYKFASKERDSESGLDYSLHRMYSNRIGRWLSRDPASCNLRDPQQTNRYEYVANNPTNWLDPKGTFIVYRLPGGGIIDMDLALGGMGFNLDPIPMPTFAICRSCSLIFASIRGAGCTYICGNCSDDVVPRFYGFKCSVFSRNALEACPVIMPVVIFPLDVDLEPTFGVSLGARSVPSRLTLCNQPGI